MKAFNEARANRLDTFFSTEIFLKRRVEAYETECYRAIKSFRSMTSLKHNRESLYQLETGDGVCIGERPYFFKKRTQGGMGFILFLELDFANAPKSFSVHGLRVALKSILPSALDNETASLFRRELAIWSGFQYGQIVYLNEILDAGRDGWIAAMDWHPGSLRTHMSTRASLEVLYAFHVICDVLNALAYAYKKDRVIHRDLCKTH